MEDALGEISFGVHMDAEENAEGCLITVTADKEWLEDAERVYPVRIDPAAIQIPSSAIHVACAEEGSPDSVIGDNSYPYVGYDNGITSGNLAGFGSRHLNCRSYFSVDYDFAALSEEAEIVSAVFQVTQMTGWSKGTSEFGLYGVEDVWNVGSLNWNNQLSYNHYFLDSANSVSRNQSIQFDVTEEVSAWINGTSENHGFVMKAMLEAPNAESFAAGVGMQCEVFYNNTSTRPPKLILSWVGGITELDTLTLDDTTVEVYPVVEHNGNKSGNTLGVVAHGLARPGSTVTYSLVNGTSGQVEAQTSLVYPDSSLYQGSFPTAVEYNRRLSNWQSEVFAGLTDGQVYYITAAATQDGVTGKTAVSDTFLIYREGALDLLPRIANHYGVQVSTVMSDMRMQDALTRQGSRIFIRNPQNTSAYSAGSLDPFTRAAIDGLLLGENENCEYGYEPINLNTGNFYLETSDASVDDIGGDFSLNRQYNAKGASFAGSLGYGWSFAYDERLGEMADGSLLWRKHDGGLMIFTEQDGVYRAPAGYDYELTAAEDGYTITDLSDGSLREFNVYGLLTALADVRGSRTELSYDWTYHLQSVTSPSGKQYTFTLDESERIASVTLPDGGTVAYAYDEAGNLANVTNPAGGVIRYTYDSEHRMTAWYDGNAHCVVANEYDSEGRVVKQTDAEGAVVTLSYASMTEGGQTTAKDALGNTTVYTCDTSCRTTGITYPDGSTVQKSYNAEGYLAKETDVLGAAYTYTYDAHGNLLTRTRSDGAGQRFTYNDRNQMTSATDFDGGVTTYTYDEAYRLISVTDAAGGMTSYTYDSLNRVTSVRDGEGNTTAFSYSGACVNTVTDAEGGVWSYTYDAMNRPLTATDPTGAVTGNTYDKLGRTVKETDGAGNATSYTYDAAGAVTAITDREGQTSTFTYDRANRMTGAKDPMGNTLTCTYDANGNLLTETDAEGITHTYVYDNRNRVATETDGRGNKTGYTYNAAGQITGVTDRLGGTTATVYDAVTKAVQSVTDAEGNITACENDVMGRPVVITYADGSTVRYAYDKLSRPVSFTNEIGTVMTIVYDKNGNITSLTEGERSYRYAYDRRGNLIRTTDPLGNSVSFSYDGAGNLTAVTDENGNTTQYTYDALHRLSTVEDALEGVTSYSYDKEDRLIRTATPEGAATAYTYNAIGELVRSVDALGNETTYVYDAISRPTAQTNALGGVVSYTYDADSNVTSVRDENGKTHSYTLDAEGNLLADTCPNGEKESYTYDKNGNVATYTDRAGVVTTLIYDERGRVIKAYDTAGNEMTYTYDGAGNLLTQTDVLGRTAGYEYDTYSRPVKITEADGATTAYTYDLCDRLTSVTDAEGNVTTYTYDRAGNLTGRTEPGDAAYAYAYDALNRLSRIVDAEGAATEFVYDKNGNLTERTDGNGVTTAFAYDALDRLVTCTDGNGGDTVYSYDALGRLTAVTSPEGLTESYTYDPVGNLLSVTDGNHETTRYTYDDLYRLVRKKSPLGAVERYTYDSHDIVIGESDALGGETIYEVDANGLVTSLTQANGGVYTYTYDAVHRLVGITTPLGYETLFTYSTGDDILTESDNLDRTTSYTYDRLHRVTSLTDAEGGVTTYTYDERGNQTGITNALGYTYSYAYDKVNRMVTVTDPEEKVTGLLYDGAGNVTAITQPGERTTSYTYDGDYNIVGVTDPMGYSYGYSYDGDDRLVETKDPLAQATVYAYDGADRMTSYTDRLGRVQSYAYDAHGNLTGYTDAAGFTTTYAYDLKDRLTSVTDAQGSTAFYTYDEMDNLISVTDYMGRGTRYTYDVEGNLTSITDAAGRTEKMTYDVAGRVTSYTFNSGRKIRYSYDKLNDLVEKSYEDAGGRRMAAPVEYAYNALGERVDMFDATGETEYTCDGLGRITSVTTYRTQLRNGETDKRNGDTVGYEYDEADNLSAILYPDGSKVSYEYDRNGNLLKVTDKEGRETVYAYDALNRVTEIHRPDNISTFITYDAEDQITRLTNTRDRSGRPVSSYSYTYDERGQIISEVETTVTENRACLHPYEVRCGHCGRQWEWDEVFGDRDEDHPSGRCAGCGYYWPDGNGRAPAGCGRTVCGYRLVRVPVPACTQTRTVRTFSYDESGKLIGSTERTDCGAGISHTYEYDLMGNRSAEITTDCAGRALEDVRYTYNDSNQLTEKAEKKGCYTERTFYRYDQDGNLVCEYNGYTVYGYGCGYGGAYRYAGSGYGYGSRGSYAGTAYGCGSGYARTDLADGAVSCRTYRYDVENRLEAVYEGGALLMAAAYDGDGNRVFELNYNPYADSAEDILFPVAGEVSRAEEHLIQKITTCNAGSYELTEYINDVNRTYTEVLTEQNMNGRTLTEYTYGVERISAEKYNRKCDTTYYLYDGRGSVTALTDDRGTVTNRYTYDAFGAVTSGVRGYSDFYAFNAESYNPNTGLEYLRARYYHTETASFLTEDSYLGNLTNPLTLNRYLYCLANPVKYTDPSGMYSSEDVKVWAQEILNDGNIPGPYKAETIREKIAHMQLLESMNGGVGAVMYEIHTEEYYLQQYRQQQLEKNGYIEKCDSKGNRVLYFADVIQGVVNNENIELHPRESWGIIGKGRYEGFHQNSKGQYEVAVGPRIVDPDYPDDGKIREEDIEGFSGYFVVYLTNKETNEQKIIECVVADIKAHSYNTYPDGHPYDTGDVAEFDVANGIMQTGIAYPHSWNASQKESFASDNIDGSIIEFAGSELDFTPGEYELDRIVVVTE